MGTSTRVIKLATLGCAERIKKQPGLRVRHNLIATRMHEKRGTCDQRGGVHDLELLDVVLRYSLLH